MARPIEYTEVIYVTRPRCPFCGATGFEHKGTEQQGDGSVKRKKVCRSCQSKFAIVVEETTETEEIDCDD